MITETCQRFTEGREHRRPAGELIRPSEYDIGALSPGPAKAFVEAHHYSRSCSPPAHPFGLWRRGELVGAAVFGPMPSMNAHRAVFPTLGTTEAVTLGRLVLLDEVPGNGESYFVARCFDLLRGRGIVAVESCADPEPRTDAYGHATRRGHVGTIYCALNGRYVGRTRASTLRLLPDGSVLSNRAQGKIVRTEQGRAYAEAGLVAHGADPLQPEEDQLAWLRHWRGKLTRPMRHRGNLRYIWSLDRRRRHEVLDRHAALPYLKMSQLEVTSP